MTSPSSGLSRLDAAMMLMMLSVISSISGEMYGFISMLISFFPQRYTLFRVLPIYQNGLSACRGPKQSFSVLSDPVPFPRSAKRPHFALRHAEWNMAKRISPSFCSFVTPRRPLEAQNAPLLHFAMQSGTWQSAFPHLFALSRPRAVPSRRISTPFRSSPCRAEQAKLSLAFSNHSCYFCRRTIEI